MLLMGVRFGVLNAPAAGRFLGLRLGGLATTDHKMVACSGLAGKRFPESHPALCEAGGNAQFPLQFLRAVAIMGMMGA